jgi:hypothetical protein
MLTAKAKAEVAGALGTRTPPFDTKRMIPYADPGRPG